MHRLLGLIPSAGEREGHEFFFFFFFPLPYFLPFLPPLFLFFPTSILCFLFFLRQGLTWPRLVSNSTCSQGWPWTARLPSFTTQVCRTMHNSHLPFFMSECMCTCSCEHTQRLEEGTQCSPLSFSAYFIKMGFLPASAFLGAGITSMYGIPIYYIGLRSELLSL